MAYDGVEVLIRLASPRLQPVECNSLARFILVGG